MPDDPRLIPRTLVKVEEDTDSAELLSDLHIAACDVWFSSVCCEYALLLLVNKEAALAYGRAE